jgi:hypothetical protein
MTTFGGPAAFVERLNYLHDQNITYIGNEPAFLTVYQYHYAGRPALSALRTRNQPFSLFPLLNFAVLGLPKSVSSSQLLLFTGNIILIR